MALLFLKLVPGECGGMRKETAGGAPLATAPVPGRYRHAVLVLSGAEKPGVGKRREVLPVVFFPVRRLLVAFQGRTVGLACQVQSEQDQLYQQRRGDCEGDSGILH